MTFKRLFGIGIFTIIYGLCAVGWADVKPIDPVKECPTQLLVLPPNTTLAGFLNAYTQFGTLVNGRYVMCFDGKSFPPNYTAKPIAVNLVPGKPVVFYNLAVNGSQFTTGNLFTFNGNDALLQNVQIVGPGSGMLGSTGVALSGSNLSIINSTISGFETAIQAKGDTLSVSDDIIKDVLKAIDISGNNVGIQNSTLTGSSNIVAGTIGIAMSGSGHTVTANTITGFDIAVKADCASPSPQPSPEGEGVASCTIGPKVVTDNVKQGVVVPATGQGVTITQTELRTVADPYGDTTQKIVLQGAANGGLTPPTFSVDPATMTIWKTLSDDKKFVTEIGGVLPKNGTIELFEHKTETQTDLTQKYRDYFRASCPTTQNDKGMWEFKCTGLNIDAKIGQVFVNVTYAPNTSAMTKLIDVKDIPEPKTAAVNPGQGFSGGSLTDSPASGTMMTGGDGGTIVGGAGETVAMNDGGFNVGNSDAPPHHDTLPSDEGNTDAGGGGTAAAMTGGGISLGGEGAPASVGPSAGCGGQLMPEKTPADPMLFVILLMPIVLLLQVRRANSKK